MRPILIFTFCFLSIHSFLPAHPASADAFSLAAEIGNRLRSEQIEDPSLNVGWGRATAVINAPLSDVESTIRDYAHYAELLPMLTQSRLLTQRGDRAQVYFEARLLHGALTVWANATIVTRRDDNGRHTIEARMTQGNANFFVARWQLDPLDDKTLVTFQVLADPDVPVPDRLITLGNQEAARLTLVALRHRYP